MKKILMTLLLVVAWCITGVAQDGLNIAPFFSDRYKSDATVTIVEMSGESLKMSGLTQYKSISVINNAALSDKLEKAVRKDGALSKSKEVIYKKGQLYFGMYSMGMGGKHCRYLYYLNQRPVGKEKTMLIFIEGDISEKEAKSIINR